jgi:predicted Ser/Thr protein kinase
LKIIRLLGKGGMGAVYQAQQPALDRTVALKILPVIQGKAPEVAERFAREARALARLQHPNIVALYEFGHAGAFHYFIMEYVDGLNLRQLQASARLAPRAALDIVPQICEALQYAHDQGVVHRDIKPENVLITRDGKVKIADFGIAKIANQPTAMPLTVEGELMGTPHYMAPEQVERPSEVDHRADIFSLGVVFYEMLTGELPLGKFPPPSRKVQVDIRLDEIVMQALEKEPQRRYQHVSEVKTQIQHLADPAPPADDRILMRVPAWNAGVEYKTRATLFGFPWVHVATGVNPETGRPRIATGIIAIGNVARGGIAFGGVAMGGIAFGGLALGAIAFGGLGIGLIALAGMAVGLLAAFGGGAIAPVALGGGSIGYYGFGGGTLAKYGMSAMGVDPEAWDFFQPWVGPLIDNSHPIFMGLVILSVFIGNSVPAWLQRHNKAVTRQPAYWVQLGIPVLCLVFLAPILFISRPKITGVFKAMISGETVSALTGNPVPNVQIKLLDPDKKLGFWLLTQSQTDGTYSALLNGPRLAKTKSLVQATAAGYEPQVIGLATNAFDSKGHLRLRFVLTPISAKSGSGTNAANVTEE